MATTRTSTTLRALGVGTALLLVATACGGGGDDDASTASEDLASRQVAEELGDPVHGGAVTVGLEAETNSFLPSEAAWTPSGRNVANALFDTLLARDADGRVQPNLARSFSANEALTAWTVELRPGVRFHDGAPFDAAALQAVVEEHLAVPGAATAGSLAQVEEVRVDGELTATYVLRAPDASFPDVLTGPAGMPFSVAAARAAGDEAGARPAGTGPFRIESWAPDDRLVVVRNESYWREGLPYLDQITFRPLPDERSRLDALLTGGIDAMHSLRGSTIRELLDHEDAGVTAFTASGDDAGIIALNVLRPPFDDVRVRRALAHTIDPAAVAESLGEQDLVAPATQLVGETSPWWSEAVAAAKPAHDPAEAARLLAAYVADASRSDGRAVGEPVAFELGCVPDASLQDLLQVLEGNAEAAGFDVELAVRDQAAHVAATMGDASTDPPFAGDFSASCFRLAPQADIATTFATSFGDPARQQGNVSNFHDAAIAELLAELRTTADFDEQHALVEQIGVAVNEAAPFLYGTSTPTAMGVRDGVTHVTGWTLPDGSTAGNPTAAIAHWGQVWRAP